MTLTAGWKLGARRNKLLIIYTVGFRRVENFEWENLLWTVDLLHFRLDVSLRIILIHVTILVQVLMVRDIHDHSKAGEQAR